MAFILDNSHIYLYQNRNRFYYFREKSFHSLSETLVVCNRRYIELCEMVLFGFLQETTTKISLLFVFFVQDFFCFQPIITQIYTLAYRINNKNTFSYFVASICQIEESSYLLPASLIILTNSHPNLLTILFHLLICLSPSCDLLPNQYLEYH